MKIQKKHTHLLEDRFAASERGVSVDIRRHRSIIIIDITCIRDGKPEHTRFEGSLSELADALCGLKKIMRHRVPEFA